MTPLRVAVDALSTHFGGGGTVLLEQCRGLGALPGRIRLRVLGAPWNVDALAAAAGPSADTACVDVRDGWPRAVWEQLALARHLDGVDVLYCPGNALPLLGTPVPTVLAVQNPNFFGAGDEQPHNRAPGRRARRALARASVRRADRVVAVSHALAAAVAADVPEAAGRIEVIPLGRPELPADGTRPAALPAGWSSFWLSLANDAPHKHLDRTVQAWARARARAPGRVPGLVIAGVVDADRRARQRATLDPGDAAAIVHLGAVTDRREVAWLLHHARGLVSSSSLESFGLTLVEAGDAGCPLVVTDLPAHREVARAHAAYAPVGDIEAMATAILRAPAPPVRWVWPVTWSAHADALATAFERAAARPAAPRLGSASR